MKTELEFSSRKLTTSETGRSSEGKGRTKPKMFSSMAAVSSFVDWLNEPFPIEQMPIPGIQSEFTKKLTFFQLEPRQNSNDFSESPQIDSDFKEVSSSNTLNEQKIYGEFCWSTHLVLVIPEDESWRFIWTQTDRARQIDGRALLDVEVRSAENACCGRCRR
jgi:hypothetical protein